MKRLNFPFGVMLLVCMAVTQIANANIWRVNKMSDYVDEANSATKYGANVGGTPSYPVFKEMVNVRLSTLVSGGDTIHLEGCPPGDPYNSVTIFKKLTIIGSGYFLDENTNVSNDLLPSKLVGIDFGNGSEGSQLIGVWMRGSDGAGGYITINASNITIKRCKIDWVISLGDKINDISLIANYFDNIVQPTGSCINTNNANTPGNFIIKNNIFKKPIILKGETIASPVAHVLECHNNVFDCPVLAGSPSILLNSNSFRNNILKTKDATVQINAGNDSGIIYNTSASANQFGTGAGSNNIIAADIDNLFINTGTSDGRYRLKPASTDNVPGEDGTERGVFGGSAFINRYTISGLAPIPVIYSITTSGVADSTGLPVTFKARIIK